jgi:hypothetical protein
MDSTRKTKTTGKKTGVATQHTGAATSNQRAIWNTDCNAMLIKCLEAHKRDGRMGSNSSWHKDVWADTEQKLAGTEQTFGGAKKSADSCHNRCVK